MSRKNNFKPQIWERSDQLELKLVQNLLNSKNVGGRHGSGYQDGGCREWSSWKIKHDSAILQRHFYKRLQENHWSWFFGETNPVRTWPFYPLGFDLWTVFKTFIRIIITIQSKGRHLVAEAHGIVGGGFQFFTWCVSLSFYLFPHFHLFSLPSSFFFFFSFFPLCAVIFALCLFCAYWWHFGQLLKHTPVLDSNKTYICYFIWKKRLSE